MVFQEPRVTKAFPASPECQEKMASLDYQDNQGQWVIPEVQENQGPRDSLERKDRSEKWAIQVPRGLLASRGTRENQATLAFLG